jgi:hypothetical protein
MEDKKDENDGEALHAQLLEGMQNLLAQYFERR